MYKTINARIRKIREVFCHDSNKEFAKLMGKKENVVNNWIREGYSVGRGVANEIANQTGVNIDWLMTGKGEMLKNQTSELSTVEPGGAPADAWINEKNMVPLYDLGKMVALNGSFIGEHQKPIDYVYIPNVSACDGAAFVRGNAMAPYLSAGDIVLFQHIKNIPSGIYFGEIYLLSLLLEGNEYVVIRKVTKSNDQEQVSLTGYNPEAKPQDIPVESIQAMAIVKAGIKYISTF